MELELPALGNLGRPFQGLSGLQSEVPNREVFQPWECENHLLSPSLAPGGAYQ